MSTELDDFFGLFTKEPQNALTYLKDKPELESQIVEEFSAVLEVLNKKRLSSITTLLRKIHNNERLKPQEKMAIILHPILSQNIEVFSLSECKLTILPDEITNLSNLKDFDLAVNKISSFSPNLMKIQSIKRIRLSNNHLTFYPEEINQLKNLEILEIYKNRISSLPTSISNLKNLSYLDLSSNRLVQLPNEITKLKKLETLLLGDNKIKTIPENFGDLSKLKQLNIGNWKNRIKSIPQSFGKLKKLEVLLIVSTEYIDNLKYICECTSLKTLSLGLGKNEEIPSEIASLSKLIRLEIYGESKSPLIKTLPDGIGDLTELRRLALYDLHALTNLPNTLFKLKNLQTLDVVGHSISRSDQEKIKKTLPKCLVRF